MQQSSLQLWELLLLARNSKIPVQITCAECFTLIEYDADLLVAGVSIDEIRSSIRHHLSLCSGCESEFDQWLEKLEGAENSEP